MAQRVLAMSITLESRLRLRGMGVAAFIHTFDLTCLPQRQQVADTERVHVCTWDLLTLNGKRGYKNGKPPGAWPVLPSDGAPQRVALEIIPQAMQSHITFVTRACVRMG